ncbi:TetR/AcrR family transcriptional regulator [Pseudonocardia kunmingensis]|uniref:TetR family transcriptional regulator n=1 Tax=Pseudonocardia kunmingensis TaxID=630975 RepID=A0A543D3Z0_9PSEU|nr:TetR/AcrR family transcriptional regulator [Pseudonocardia kunmingensis]TQM03898.1 TetR family transcriptional regulator [Pseudonocardia kunmingensis]
MSATASERGREVRRRLTRAARELVPERGWAAVSTRTVAERAGVAPGLVHYHFPSLQALLAEAAIGALREALGATADLLERARTPDELVELLVAEVDRYTGADPASLLAVETHLAATRDPALRGELAGLLEDFRGRIAAWLAEHGVGEPEATAAVLAAALDGVLLHRALEPQPTGAVTPVLRRIVAQHGGR